MAKKKNTEKKSGYFYQSNILGNSLVFDVDDQPLSEHFRSQDVLHHADHGTSYNKLEWLKCEYEIIILFLRDRI